MNTCYGGRGAYRVLVWKLEGKRPLAEDPGLEGRVILKWIFRKWDGDMDWIDLVQNRDSWRAIVNAVINFRVP
jgi:hypothetical protein